uniref:putative RING-H2 finger protein ATL35 n=1 Tax=Fragaria vesca subsp. vesca TaxID=101020 RepID=UPI0005C9D6BB|nr:PREDICTED: putative RING-H2 finger protein ATL35 [Fragaria vesca subsp. vesca]
MIKGDFSGFWGTSLPETVYEEILYKLFPAIYATECYQVPLVVVVTDDTYQRESDEVLSFTPTAHSAIEGLEKVRIDAAIIDGESSPMCAICWKDFTPEEGMLTRMPCSHCYHGDCIVCWLSVNQLCPMCRYPMPVATQLPPSAYNPLKRLNILVRRESRSPLYYAAASLSRGFLCSSSQLLPIIELLLLYVLYCCVCDVATLYLSAFG